MYRPERKTNVWVVKNIKREWTLESGVAQAALICFGHVVGKERGIMKRGMMSCLRE